MFSNISKFIQVDNLKLISDYVLALAKMWTRDLTPEARYQIIKILSDMSPNKKKFIVYLAYQFMAKDVDRILGSNNFIKNWLLQSMKNDGISQNFPEILTFGSTGLNLSNKLISFDSLNRTHRIHRNIIFNNFKKQGTDYYFNDTLCEKGRITKIKVWCNQKASPIGNFTFHMLKSLEEEGMKIFEIIVDSVQKKHRSSSKGLAYLGHLEYRLTELEIVNVCWNPIVELIWEHDKSIDLFTKFWHDSNTYKTYVLDPIGPPVIIPEENTK
ncbi:hypothetical protein PPL_02371 [Heterostelium album PN500]|uniref:Uncharacterized protein n=1 Tax=Heterostelium pallidum (strain ATCC 26659 / Pp 5 / PN500) TaxID=670386 RepID=D3AZI9_HETP5|nr:hypothetical protein PPL_02371 [Heterostelium album PN500]EFA85368.1 hypothetical protein PPL_02371 [Heterostelium album PN500]|eukprot:XP_020437477.1 hypothetical protein PPL_02371 [Heterostelium album PN500]